MENSAFESPHCACASCGRDVRTNVGVSLVLMLYGWRLQGGVRCRTIVSFDVLCSLWCMNRFLTHHPGSSDHTIEPLAWWVGAGSFAAYENLLEDHWLEEGVVNHVPTLLHLLSMNPAPGLVSIRPEVAEILYEVKMALSRSG